MTASPEAEAGKTHDRGRMLSRTAVVLVIGGVASVVGSVLPWVTFAGNSLSGIDRDGVVTLPLAAIVIAIAVVLRAMPAARNAARRWAAACLCVSAVVGLVAAVDIVDIAWSVVTVGLGVWLVAAGSLVTTIGAVLLVRTTSSTSRRDHSRLGPRWRFWYRNPQAVLVVLIAFVLAAVPAAPAAAQSGSYGAWVLAPGEGIVVAGLGDTDAAAAATAVAACHAGGGGRDCQPRAWFRNAYSTFAQSAADAESYGVGWADSSDAADSIALTQCAQTGQGDCSIKARSVTADPSSADGAVYQTRPSYGAWAYSVRTGKVAAGRGDTPDEAKSAARDAACSGDQDAAAYCQVVARFENAYSTFAQSSDGLGAFGVGWADNPASAESEAVAACRKQVSGGCEITARGETSQPWSPQGEVYQAGASYGVWAISMSTGVSAAAVATTRAQAEPDATAACRAQGGGPDCTPAAWFRNGYSVLAKASNGRWTVSVGWTKPVAEQLALHKCTEKGPDCGIVNRAITGDPWSPDVDWIKEPMPAVTPSPGEPPVPVPGATPPSPQPPSLRYAALGDSYSAGEGLEPLSEGCHRSSWGGYPLLLAPRIQGGSPPTFPACSGAVTDDVVSNSTGLAAAGRIPTNAGDGKQLAHVDADLTKVVTITVGGNDAGFADVLKKCAQGPLASGRWDCMKDANGQLYSTVLQRIRRLDGTPGSTATTPESRTIRPLQDVLAGIGDAAPKAMIYVGTYPKIFGTKTTVAYPPAHQRDTRVDRRTPRQVCEVGSLIDPQIDPAARPYTVVEEDVTRINQLADKLNAVIRAAVDSANSNDAKKNDPTGKRFHLVEADKLFAGYGLCDTEQQSWINGVQLDYVPNPNAPPILPDEPRSASFHPTKDGQCAYEQAFEQLIAKHQPQIMAKDLGSPPSGCEGERDAQRARLHDHGGRIRDWLVATAQRLFPRAA